MSDFQTDLNRRYWDYVKRIFPDGQNLFEKADAQDDRPPVFVKSEAWRNVIIDPEATPNERKSLLDLVPDKDRHRWFGSMNSSQALAQSVLGNLVVHDSIHLLSELKDDEDEALLGERRVSRDSFEMEHEITHLGESRSTSLDGFFSGEYQIAIECKFTEQEIGTCSRPRIRSDDSNYRSDWCDGTFSVQRGRKSRCSLSEVGILYWDYVPKLFHWRNDQDLNPCPVYKNYQLVRNVLAIGVRPDNSVSLDGGHVVLIYDDRNPAFQFGGEGHAAVVGTREALLNPRMLRKVSWQRIVSHMRDGKILPWLTRELNLKYGV